VQGGNQYLNRLYPKVQCAFFRSLLAQAAYWSPSQAPHPLLLVRLSFLIPAAVLHIEGVVRVGLLHVYMIDYKRGVKRERIFTTRQGVLKLEPY